MEAQRAAVAQQKELEQASASAEAARKWEAATEPRPGHPYLKKKGLSGTHGARQLGNFLVLPIQNVSGVLMNIQTIAPDGEKRFHPGAPKAGRFFGLGINAAIASQPVAGKTGTTSDNYDMWFAGFTLSCFSFIAS